MADDRLRLILDRYARVLASVDRTISMVELIVRQNRRIADRYPAHRGAAEQRVVEGEAELAELTTLRDRVAEEIERLTPDSG